MQNEITIPKWYNPKNYSTEDFSLSDWHDQLRIRRLLFDIHSEISSLNNDNFFKYPMLTKQQYQNRYMSLGDIYWGIINETFPKQDFDIKKTGDGTAFGNSKKLAENFPNLAMETLWSTVDKDNWPEFPENKYYNNNEFDYFSYDKKKSAELKKFRKTPDGVNTDFKAEYEKMIQSIIDNEFAPLDFRNFNNRGFSLSFLTVNLAADKESLISDFKDWVDNAKNYFHNQKKVNDLTFSRIRKFRLFNYIDLRLWFSVNGVLIGKQSECQLSKNDLIEIIFCDKPDHQRPTSNENILKNLNELSYTCFTFSFINALRQVILKDDG